MSTERNSFIDASESLSQEIYRRFYIGSVINRKEYLESQAKFIDSTLYSEIMHHEQHYQQMYRFLGYDLVRDEEGEFISLKLISEADADDKSDDKFDESTLKIIAILTIISRIMTHRGQPLLSLGEAVQGITANDLSIIAEDTTSLAILKAMKIKSPDDAIDFIRKKGFAFKVSQGRHVLSTGAMTMLQTLIDRQKQINEQDA
jgi:hypothetical protein